MQLYQRACGSGAEPDTEKLRYKLAEALVNAGRGPEAARLFLELAQQESHEGRARGLRRRAAEQYIRAGYVPEALAEYRPLLNEAGLALPRTPTTALTSLLWHRLRLKMRGLNFIERSEREVSATELDRIDYCWVLSAGLAGIDLVRSAHYHSVSLLLALESGEPARISRGLSLHAALQALEHTDNLPIAEKHAAVAYEIASRIKDSHALGWAVAAKTIIAFGRVELAQAIELADEATTLLRERSESTFREIGSLEVWFALHSVFLSGRLNELAQRGPACAREAEARGDRYTLSTVRAYALPLHWAVLDRPEQARREADAAIANWPEDSFYHQHWARLRAHCLLDLYEGRGSEAMERVQQFRPRMKKALHFRIRTPRVEFNYLEARGALEKRGQQPGQVPERSLIQKKIGELRDERYGLADAFALILEAGLAACSDRQAAAAAFEAAERELERLHIPLHRAACARRAAECRDDPSGIEKADAALAALGVVNQARFSDMLVPKVPA